MINPTLLAKTVRSSTSAAEARTRVIQSYRQWLRAAPEIQTLYTLNMPVSRIRNQIRAEFERNRRADSVPKVDVLILKSDQEFQETMNFWKQAPQLLKYFDGAAAENVRAQPPRSFVDAFLQGRN